MIETDIARGHTETTLHVRGVNRMLTEVGNSLLFLKNSTNVNSDFMREKVKSTLVVLIL